MNIRYILMLTACLVTKSYGMDGSVRHRTLDEQNKSAKHLCVAQALLGFVTGASLPFVDTDEVPGLDGAILSGSLISTAPLAFSRIEPDDLHYGEKIVISYCCYFGGLITGSMAAAVARQDWSHIGLYRLYVQQD